MKRTPVLQFFLMLCLGISLAAGASAAQTPTEQQQAQLGEVFVQGISLKDYLKEHPGMGYAYVDANGRTTMPLRAVVELLDLEVAYQESDRSITIKNTAAGTVKFFLGSSTYTVNGQAFFMDTAPAAIGGRAHVPVRYLVEGIGGSVYYVPKGTNVRYNVVEIYYHANDVTPTAPDWAGGDYVTFDRTSAYTPENWAIITDLRERAARGEDVDDACNAFRNRFQYRPNSMHYYDYGVEYEMLLIDAERKTHGYKLRTFPYGKSKVTPSTYTPEQENSIARWSMRDKAISEAGLNLFFIEFRDICYPTLLGGVDDNAGISSYDPDHLAVFDGPVDQFLSEPWFDKLPAKPIPIYFDNDCFRNSTVTTPSNSPVNMAIDSVLTEGGVTRVDLELIGSCLSLKRGSDDYHVASTRVAWANEAHDAAGEISAVEMDWDGKTIRVKKGDAYATVDGRRVDLGAGVTARNNHLYVPIAFLSDVLGESVTFDREVGAWFVRRDHHISSENLEQWALAMSAVMCRRGDGNPYYLGMYNRCMRMQVNFVPSPYYPDRLTRSYSYYPAYHLSRAQLERSWGCLDGEDIRTQAKLLTANPNRDYPAWDLFRVAHIASWGYSAGYLTADEALELVKPAAQLLHDTYSSWDEAYEDWITGYQVCFGGDGEECALRRELYSELKKEQEKRGILFDDSLFQKPVN